ncbi:AzlC family ABC transporter permease [Desulfobacula toluolica]|uniref:AzlC: branched-chain amino acid transport protein n=1 Tax=Desulfobacula toluolica (strain DSM 7467 / Tol2) TaxID=651182 RepID=K0NT47_DESTT|nr:AzlC family ABC transporter permease [Desulfobacula toluolica]CCK82217.1 AzlC: branched-chain amino acid transport protein [Desulfobacula toluolica Tol2]
MTRDVRNAFKSGIPIFIGYVPAAIAFGILAKGCDITLLECFLFSAVVFAGASQFIALNLLMTGMGPGGIILTTLLVNFRHFLMSAYLSTRIGKIAKRYLFLMAFGVTDEVFSVLSFTTGRLSKTYVFVLQLSAYSGWVSGTVAGYILGGFLPQILTRSMGVALYALLLAILLPEMKRSVKAVILTIASGLLNTLLIKLDLLPNGWSIIVCILVIAWAGSFFITKQTGEKAYE